MFEIREGQLGKGLYATTVIKAGTRLLQGWGPDVPHRTRHSIQVDHDRHVRVEGPIELINHSCEPNCGILIRRDAESMEIHSLRTIERGEQLTTDYASFESEIQHMPKQCLCGSATCRGQVVGYDGLPGHRRAALGPYVAEYLQENASLISRSA